MDEKLIKKTINNLKEYIEDDEIYKQYNLNPDGEFSDFDMFCVDHCKDIENMIKAYEEEKLKSDGFMEALTLVKQKKNTDKSKYRRKATTLRRRIREALQLIDDGIDSCSAEAEGTVNDSKCWMAVNRLKSIREKLVK